ncbi:MAG: IS4/IS5 family transposase, partial [Aphanocapsa feldmannii 277cV]
REENKDIKQGKVPEAWKKNLNRLRQKDLDARWVKKNNLNYYGYKNSICIDAKYGFIRRHVITPANRHDSQMLMALLDGENKEDMVWADSGYAGRIFADVLQLAV